jgi:hypothetical protein
MATLYLANAEQRRVIRNWLIAIQKSDPHLEISPLCIALTMLCRDIGIEVFEDNSANAKENLMTLLGMFGYGLAKNEIGQTKLIRLEQ